MQAVKRRKSFHYYKQNTTSTEITLTSKFEQQLNIDENYTSKANDKPPIWHYPPSAFIYAVTDNKNIIDNLSQANKSVNPYTIEQWR